MSRAVMLSIRPKWCVEIANGRKTIEVRKTRPKIEPPFKCYIYCTKDPKIQFWKNPRYSYADDHSHNKFDRYGNGKVIGEFVCDWIEEFQPCDYGTLSAQSCLTLPEICGYIGDKGRGPFGWHISDLVIYDTPKTLQEFGITMPPQSWRYVEEKP